VGALSLGTASHLHRNRGDGTFTFGLARAAKIDSLEIRWPDGSRETRWDIARGATVVIEESVTSGFR
jgi:hypothetical protein